MATIDITRRHRLDRIAIGLSGLCAVHCITTALLVGMFSSFASIFESPVIHEAGLAIAIALGALALGFGALRHRRLLPLSIGVLGLGIMASALAMPHGAKEIVVTLIGLATLALGHELNRRAH
jgi:uncharacterized membrane protein